MSDKIIKEIIDTSLSNYYGTVLFHHEVNPNGKDEYYMILDDHSSRQKVMVSEKLFKEAKRLWS